MLETYYGNISVAKAEELVHLLWGNKANLTLVSEQSRQIGERIRKWLQRKITEAQVFVYFHSLEIRQKVGGSNSISTVMAAIGINGAGTREILGVMETADSEQPKWMDFALDLRQRGLEGVELFIGGVDPALRAAVRTHFPRARYQVCLLQLERETLALVPARELNHVTALLAAMRAAGTHEEARGAALATIADLRENGLAEAAMTVEQSMDGLFCYFHFPRKYWPRLQNSEPLRTVMRQFRERIRVIGPVPDNQAFTLMLAARLRYISRITWSRRRFMATSHS